MVTKGKLQVKGIQQIPSGARYKKGTLWSKVCQGYQVVQGIQQEHSDPRNPKGTWYKVPKGYQLI